MSRLNPAGSHEAKRQLAARVLSDTQAWLQCAVIGLNLCPFAKAVSVKGLVYCAISEADGPQALLQDLAVELRDLAASDAAQRETTLLVAPYCLDEFLLFNEFLGKAQSLLRKEGFEGVIQLASFHPAYQFAGSASDDITNFTNRSPYPTVHLLREESIARAVQAMPDPAAIYEANMETLRRLGVPGWAALEVGPSS